MTRKTEELDLIKTSNISVWEAANVRHTELTEGLDDLAASIDEVGVLLTLRDNDVF